MLYGSASSSNKPFLYICQVSNLMSSVAECVLIPCFVAGDSDKRGQQPTSVTNDQFKVSCFTLEMEAGYLTVVTC